MASNRKNEKSARLAQFDEIGAVCGACISNESMENYLNSIIKEKEKVIDSLSDENNNFKFEVDSLNAKFGDLRLENSKLIAEKEANFTSPTSEESSKGEVKRLSNIWYVLGFFGVLLLLPNLKIDSLTGIEKEQLMSLVGIILTSLGVHVNPTTEGLGD